MRQIALLFMALLIAIYAKPQSFTIDSMKRIIHATSRIDTNKIQLYIQLAREWAKINSDSALAYTEKSYQLSYNLKYLDGQADSRLLQAKIKSDLGHFSKMYEYYFEALDKYTATNNQTGLAQVYIGLASTYTLQQDYAKALTNLNQALHIFEETRSQHNVAKTHLQMGLVHLKLNDDSRALSSYEKALQIANTIRDKNIAANANISIGGVYQKMGLYQKALSGFTKAKTLGLITNSSTSLAESYLNIGIAYRELGNYDSSFSSFQLALNHLIQQRNKEGIGKAYQGLSKLYIDKKDFAKAKENVLLSNDFASSIKSNPMLFENHNLLLRIYKSEGDYEAAAGQYEKLLTLKDNLFNDEKESSIERIKAGYELEKKQQTINELQIENSLKTTQRNTLFIAFGVTALSLILLCFTIIQIKRKRKLLIEQKSALEIQTKKLEELNVVKDKFFSILSHDLRSPMTNILGLINIITTDKNISENDKTIMFEGLKTSTTSTLETMDNILAWGRQQIRDNKREIEEVNVHEVADRVCRFLQHSANNKSIEIVNQINSDVLIMADNNRLEFVLRNLMSNALKFSHYNGKVELWTSADDTYVNIHVKDFGTGMKKELQERLFDVHKTQSLRGTAGEIGTGLGLILSNEIINENNGTLTVTSEPGQGTTFTIRHPWSLS